MYKAIFRFLVFFTTAVLVNASQASVVTTTIGFDDLISFSPLVKDGYRFDGVLNRDSNFASSPALRIYGNVPLLISRVDGENFSLESFSVLWRSTADNPWWITNDFGQGSTLSVGIYNTASFWGTPFLEVKSIKIFDSSWRGDAYYVFDNLVLSHVESVPEPSSAYLLFLGFGILIVAFYPKKRVDTSIV